MSLNEDERVELRAGMMLERTLNRPSLYVFSGLPGVGKTELARRLAARLGAVYVRIDTIEGALLECGVSATVEGYTVAYGIAEDNLRLGRSVVADCCNPIDVTRAAWQRVSDCCGAAHQDIEVVCSDRLEHHRRVEERSSAGQKHQNPTWKQVEDREYHAWSTPRLTIDTAKRSIDSVADDLLVRLARVDR